MHFSISETEECKNESGSYTLFKIFVNGAHHCSVRFSQLHNLNEQLRKEFGVSLPIFPPKKLFTLSAKDKEDRRLQLEKYLQQISQLPNILSSDSFINFFVQAQKEMQREPEADVDLNVYLMNSDKLTVNIKSYEQTEDVLEKVMNKIKIHQNNIYYFGIFLVKKDDDDSIKIVRKLQDFESPYISLKAANKLEKHKLIIRKAIFDLGLELELYEDPVAVDLLFIQAVDELSRNWILPDGTVTRQLEQLQEKNSKKDFLKLISTQKFYGYLHFKSCVSDYPEQNTKCVVSLGNRILNFRFRNKNTESDYIFKVTRIRCWKVTGINTLESNGKMTTHLELSFEYLFSKDNLKWVTLKTDQAILISMSLQTMVDEIILKKEGKSVKKPSDRHKIKITPFLTRQKSLINANGHSKNTEADGSDLNNNVARDFTKNDLFENDQFITNEDL